MVRRQQPAVVVDTAAGLTRHYLLGRPGLIARVFMPGPLTVEIALWRTGNQQPTFQGAVTYASGTYIATSPNGEPVTRAADYLDAEKALLRLRTRRRSTAAYRWPDHLVRQWRARGEKPRCDTCGHPIVDGRCRRPDLHW
jgi:hypothetical protein